MAKPMDLMFAILMTTLLTIFITHTGNLLSQDYYKQLDYVTNISIGIVAIVAYAVLIPLQKSMAERTEYVNVLYITWMKKLTLFIVFVQFLLLQYMYILGRNEGDMEDNEKIIAKKVLNKVEPSTEPPFKIDVLYTWAGEMNGIDNKRTSNNNELKYSIHSVVKNLKWVNRIFILMNPPKKKPSWFNDDYERWVTIIDHDDTYEDKQYLPSTNSNSIETTLHKVPGLSEHFIYFNDDFFIGKPLPYTHFFTSGGKPVINQMSKKAYKTTHALPITIPPMIGRFYPHFPIPLLKSQMESFEQKYPDYFNWIRSHQNRVGLGCAACTENKLPCPCMQIQGTVLPFMLKNKKAAIRYDGEKLKCSPGYVNSSCPNKLDSILKPGFLDKILQKQPPTFVIQDTTDDIHERKKMQAALNIFYKKMFPDKSRPPFYLSSEEEERNKQQPINENQDN
jgi:uncharacterized membrane protein